MANELMTVEFESFSGIPIKLDAATVRNAIVRGNGKVTDQEVAMFLRTCQAKRLDPLENGEVYLIKYDDRVPASLVMGYYAYVRRAERHPDYRGFKAGVVVLREGHDEPIHKEGSAVYKQIGETLIGGWCRTFRAFGNRIDESYAEVSLEEYSTHKSNWTAKPATMIRKCAISQSIRNAFPNEFEGLYTEEEMQASGAIPVDYNEVQQEKETPSAAHQMISKEQKMQILNYIAHAFGTDNGGAVIQEVCANRGINSPDKIPAEDFDFLMQELKRRAEEQIMVAEEIPDDGGPYNEGFMDIDDEPPFA